MGSPPSASDEPRLVLYDGLCGLCDRSVQWLLRHDPHHELLFAPLQGETAAALAARHPALRLDLSTMVLVIGEGEDATILLRSRAIFALCQRLRYPYRALSVFRFLPAPLTDLGYRFVAKIRYRVWGALDTCRVPSPSERARFLP